MEKKKIIAVSGSSSANSANLQLIKQIASESQTIFDITIVNNLTELPHFKVEESIENTPQIIKDLRMKIDQSDGIIICTPEYVFSIPSVLKNAIEWCVSTTVFSHKPVGLITASADGTKAHEQLKLIMQTIECRFNDDTTLLIHGIKSKFRAGIIDEATLKQLHNFIAAFNTLISENISNESEKYT
jgi:chromate reductase